MQNITEDDDAQNGHKQEVVPEPETSPFGVADAPEEHNKSAAALTEVEECPPQHTLASQDTEPPLSKRARQGDAVQESTTPTMASEEARPEATVQRATSSTSISSEVSSLSQGSRDSTRPETLSPLPRYPPLPPAPPSTPASQPGISFHWDASHFVPTFQPVANAFQLEYQQLSTHRASSLPSSPDGAATPAPTKSDAATKTTSNKCRSSNLANDDFHDWNVGERYELIRMLGRGSYGEVAQAIDKQAGRPDAFVAIKRVTSLFDQQVDAIRLYREIHILRRMRGHDCIIKLLGVIQPPSRDVRDFHELYMVFECKDMDHKPDVVVQVN
jgi:hypothetical protein